MRGFFHYANVQSEASRKDQAYGKFLEFMKMDDDYEDEGRVRVQRKHTTAEFREMLFDVLPDLNPEFLSTQQDPCEIIYKIIQYLLPESLSFECSITIGNWTKCRDRPCAVSEELFLLDIWIYISEATEFHVCSFYQCKNN